MKRWSWDQAKQMTLPLFCLRSWRTNWANLGWAAGQRQKHRAGDRPTKSHSSYQERGGLMRGMSMWGRGIIKQGALTNVVKTGWQRTHDWRVFERGAGCALQYLYRTGKAWKAPRLFYSAFGDNPPMMKGMKATEPNHAAHVSHQNQKIK